MASHYLEQASTVLDLGTGGGEFLSQLPIQHKKVYATECYKPNVAIAKNRLEPLGIEVIGLAEEEPIPIAPNKIDVILSRHESFRSDEVYKLLKQQGVFITQQVGSENNKEFNEMLGAEPYDYANMTEEKVQVDLIQAGFQIEYSKEVKTYTRYYDLGAILFYLKAVEWQIPNFGPEYYKLGLLKIAEVIDEVGYFDATCHRFIVVASK